MKRSRRFTQAELEAIEEALAARLAGLMDAEQPREVYESAQDKVAERRAAAKGAK